MMGNLNRLAKSAARRRRGRDAVAPLSLSHLRFCLDKIVGPSMQSALLRPFPLALEPRTYSRLWRWDSVDTARLIVRRQPADLRT